MTRNDPLVLRSAPQASTSRPTQGLEFGPSPKQKAVDKVKIEEAPQNPCEKGATTNTTTTTTTTTKVESPCEKDATNNTTTITTKEEEKPCEKVAATNNTTTTTTNQEIPCEKEATTSNQAGSVDYGASSSSTASSSSSSQNPAPKKEAKSVTEPLEKREQQEQPKSLDKRPMPHQQQSKWQQEAHQVWRKKAQPAVPWEEGNGETAAPCGKGKGELAVPCGKGKNEPAGQKFFYVPTAEGQKPRYAVAVDWYNTLYIKDRVPAENLDSLWKLYDEGYEVHLLSFSGYNRSLETKRQAWGLGFPFESINFTQNKGGWYGKGQWLQDKKIRCLFDDSQEVLDDCLWRGIWVYQIAKYPSLHQYRSFKDAVTAFLRRYPLK